MHSREAGFSMIKLMFILAILGGGAWVGYNIFPVFNAKWKVQDTFKGITQNMAENTETEIRNRLPDLFRVKYLNHDDLPQEFYDNLSITATGSSVTISSSYHVTLWLLGPLQSANPNEYNEVDLKGMDKLRAKARVDYDFEVRAP